ncbi:hypothetical protein AAAU36_01790 [Phascolarctobacterium faecium]|uniref:hypothetical protein n=1 Tax=Phascolarctobacterium faecium TaxID=33025 RepID=UPI0015B0E8A3|nr:hypothetical protein [uncultured Phascolarctobacterium sp.]
MKIWKDADGREIKVEMCAAGLYVVRGVGQIDRLGRVVVGPTSSKALAQDFLDSWAEKRLLHNVDDFDVDLYNERLDAVEDNCAGCLFWGNCCERIERSD